MNNEDNIFPFRSPRPGSESIEDRQRRELEALKNEEEALRKQKDEQQRLEWDRSLNELNDQMHRHSNTAMDAETRRLEIEKTSEEHRKDHPGFIKDYHQYVVDTVAGVAGPLCLMFIDPLIFGPTSVRLITLGFPDMPVLASIGPLVIPISFVVMETAICLHLYHAIKESRTRTGKWRFTPAVAFWCFVAVSTGLVLPLLALSALLISAPSVDPTGGFTLQQFGLTFLALAFHLGIIGAAATRLNDAFCFVSFQLKDRKSRRMIERLRNVFTVAREKALESSRKLMTENDLYNNKYAPVPLRQFVVDKRVADFITRESNEITLQVEAQGNDSDPKDASPGTGPNTPDDSSDEDAESYERIIREQQRRSEEEVNP